MESIIIVILNRDITNFTINKNLNLIIIINQRIILQINIFDFLFHGRNSFGVLFHHLQLLFFYLAYVLLYICVVRTFHKVGIINFTFTNIREEMSREFTELLTCRMTTFDSRARTCPDNRSLISLLLSAFSFRDSIEPFSFSMF